MQVDLESGLMRGARQVASPNFDARPAGVEADLIVVHGISLPPGNSAAPGSNGCSPIPCRLEMHPYFAEIGCAAGVLAPGGHARRRPDAIRQVHRSRLACGRVQLQGREACNDFSIGVELEGTDTLPYEAAQYDALAEVVAALLACISTAVRGPPGRTQRHRSPGAKPTRDPPSTGSAPAADRRGAAVPGRAKTWIGPLGENPGSRRNVNPITFHYQQISAARADT